MNEIVQYLSAALTPVIGAITCWIAVQQYQAKKLELNLARYDKRFKVYQALKDFIAGVIDERKITANAIRQFDIATNEASFLFEDDVCEYLALVRKQAAQMDNLSSQIEPLKETGERSNERTRLAQQKSELADWFFNQFALSKVKFDTYLSIKGKRSGCCLWSSNKRKQ